MNYNLDYEKETNKKRIDNLFRDIKIIENLKSYKESPLWLEKKIKNESNRYNGLFSEEYIFNEIKNNTNLIRHYIRDPVKQSIHQSLAAEHLINNLSDIVAIIEPDSLKNMFLTQNGIVDIKQLNGNKPISKSIDFLIIGKETVYAITHKYTKESGGSQDNQYADVIKYLKNCPDNPKYNNKNLIVVAMVDGEYYNKKIPLLRDSFSNKWFLIGNISDVIIKIKEIEINSL